MSTHVIEEELLIDVEALKHKKVIIATPAYGGNVQTNYLSSIVNAMTTIKGYGLEIGLMTLTNESLITRGRNRMVYDFLQLSPSEATHLLFIDSDISFDFIEIIKLLQHDKEVVAGLYPMKSIDWDLVKSSILKTPNISVAEIKGIASPYAVNLSCNEKGEIVMKDGLIRVKHAATGFLLLERSVLLKMIREYPETAYKHDIVGDKKYGETMYALFDCIIDPVHKNYLSEDWTFCKRWTDIGGEVWVDPSIKLQHSGHYVFEGNFITYLNEVLIKK